VFRGRTVWRKTAYFSLISTTLIMLLPTRWPVNEITPSNLRAIGTMPLVFVFPALGVWWAVKSIWTRIRADKRRLVLPATLSLMLLVLTIETGVVYFGQYVREPELYVQSDGDLADIARWFEHA